MLNTLLYEINHNYNDITAIIVPRSLKSSANIASIVSDLLYLVESNTELAKLARIKYNHTKPNDSKNILDFVLRVSKANNANIQRLFSIEHDTIDIESIANIWSNSKDAILRSGALILAIIANSKKQ